MKTILITGGAGFIGSEIVKQLYDIGNYDITVLDDLTPQIHGVNGENSYLYSLIKDKCNFIKGDIRDYGLVEKVISGKEYIIHLAAETGTGQSMYRINQYNEVNIMGTSNLLQAISMKQDDIRKVVLASSRAVYGEGKYLCPNCGIVYPQGRDYNNMKAGNFDLYCDKCKEKLKLLPTAEDSLITPNSLYAFTKYGQEMMLKTMLPALGIEYTIFRLQNVYGVGQSLKNPYTGILSIFSTLLLEDKKINIFENGLESRDFINVVDVARAIIKSLDTRKSDGEIINLGSGKGTSVIEIAQTLKRIYGSKSEICVTGDFRKGDIAHNIADISKAERILDYKSTILLMDGLREFCKWVINQEMDNSGYDKSLKEMENSGMFIRNM